MRPRARLPSKAPASVVPPSRIWMVCSDGRTSGSVWYDVEEAHDEAEELTEAEGGKWGVFPFDVACSLPRLRIK